MYLLWKVTEIRWKKLSSNKDLENSLAFFNFTGNNAEDISMAKTTTKMTRKITLLIPVLLISFIQLQAQEVNNPWMIPEKYIEMDNLVEADKSSISEGKTLYKQHCKSCHGKAGQGDGYQAEKLQVNPSDLSLDDIDVQKDGELFYKIKTGRDEMHSFKVVLEEKDIWNLVNYIRTLYPE